MMPARVRRRLALRKAPAGVVERDAAHCGFWLLSRLRWLRHHPGISRAGFVLMARDTLLAHDEKILRALRVLTRGESPAYEESDVETSLTATALRRCNQNLSSRESG